MLNEMEFTKLLRRASAEGIVLLENDGLLPLKDESRIAVFGINQLSYYKSGTGSGGLVNTKYVISVMDAIKQTNLVINKDLENVYLDFANNHPFDNGNGWATEPWCQEEMPLNEELVKKVSKESDIAIINIGRLAGEDKDLGYTKGGYFLTDLEIEMIEIVTKYFEKTIMLLNIGNIIDLSFVKKYHFSACLLIYQGGMEGGNGVIDVLTGKVNPSAKMACTSVYNLEANPAFKNFGDTEKNVYQEDVFVGYRYYNTYDEKNIIYPFGYGLSYTSFAIEANLNLTNKISINGKIKNIGSFRGKETILVFASINNSKIVRPKKVLVAFYKTSELDPFEECDYNIDIDLYNLAYFEEKRSRFIVEKGKYILEVGGDSLNAKRKLELFIDEDILYPVLNDCMDEKSFKYDDGIDIEYEGDKGYKFNDVKIGNCTIEEFISQLSDHDLCCLYRAEGMGSKKIKRDSAAIFGGVTERLKEYGIPLMVCNDGPSGVRFSDGNIAHQLPIASMLACTFDKELIEELYYNVGLEMKSYEVDLLLGPGVNIMRLPLCGRNFEYYSEDPYLSGMMASFALAGLRKANVNGVIKHCLANNQEIARHDANAVISKRALREIYLKPYEIAIKEGNAYAIMTSYNPVNGWWSSSNYALNTLVLRQDYGFKGIIMTDWWAKGGSIFNPEKGSKQNACLIAKSQNDLYMVNTDAFTNSNNDDLEEGLASGFIKRSELVRNAKNILNFILLNK